MACNVFGTPVTDATLKGMTEYHDKPIEAVDRARVALEMKNAEGKDTAARDFVDKIQTNEAAMKGVRCLIYNATGSPLKLVAAFERDGKVSVSPYPTLILNGQWASFVVSTNFRGTVVYEATQYPARQWLLAWDHILRPNEYNACYGEIRPKGTYSRKDVSEDEPPRDDLITNLLASTFTHEAEDNGDVIFSAIANTDYPICEAIMTRIAALE
ncbi:23 kDa jasmonate-induced protein-like [Silene latifolia]|uniref:23 kDa jasmonate-induced protein-like n=1 Tax=Silene latifolia TaxID=37657 RepID=UPI003D76D5B8